MQKIIKTQFVCGINLEYNSTIIIRDLKRLLCLRLNWLSLAQWITISDLGFMAHGNPFHRLFQSKFGEDIRGGIVL